MTMAGQPWRRLPDESVKAYSAFTAYMQLEPADRSIDNAWRAATRQGQNRDGRRAPRQWGVWSSKYKWTARLLAYTDHLAEQDRQLWEDRKRQLRERDWEQGDHLRAHADALSEVLTEALPEARRFVRVTASVELLDGRIIQTETFDIVGLGSVSDAVSRIIERASKVQRLAADEPTDNVNYSGSTLDALIARELARVTNARETIDAQALAPDEPEQDAGTADGAGSV